MAPSRKEGAQKLEIIAEAAVRSPAARTLSRLVHEHRMAMRDASQHPHAQRISGGCADAGGVRTQAPTRRRGPSTVSAAVARAANRTAAGSSTDPVHSHRSADSSLAGP